MLLSPISPHRNKIRLISKKMWAVEWISAFFTIFKGRVIFWRYFDALAAIESHNTPHLKVLPEFREQNGVGFMSLSFIERLWPKMCFFYLDLDLDPILIKINRGREVPCTNIYVWYLSDPSKIVAARVLTNIFLNTTDSFGGRITYNLAK